MQKRLRVLKDLQAKRLDLYIAQQWDESNRSQIKKLIEANNVKVNGVVEYRANYQVKPGDIIEIEYQKEVRQDNLVAENIPLDVIYEDENLIAVNKPAGMVVHPATGNFSGTLANALAYKNQKNKFGNIRHGLINRIDKDTSGIVLAGKNNEALWYFTKQFVDRIPQKTYLAVVSGNFSKISNKEDEFVIQNYLIRNPIKRKKFSSSLDHKGRLSRTRFKFLDYSPKSDTSLIFAMPETGRTHQIRVHLSESGYPIIGDVIYNGKKYKRLMLHSFQISIMNKNKKQNLIAPIDNIFSKYLEQNFKHEVIQELLNKK